MIDSSFLNAFDDIKVTPAESSEDELTFSTKTSAEAIQAFGSAGTTIADTEKVATETEKINKVKAVVNDVTLAAENVFSPEANKKDNSINSVVDAIKAQTPKTSEASGTLVDTDLVKAVTKERKKVTPINLKTANEVEQTKAKPATIDIFNIEKTLAQQSGVEYSGAKLEKFADKIIEEEKLKDSTEKVSKELNTPVVNFKFPKIHDDMFEAEDLDNILEMKNEKRSEPEPEPEQERESEPAPKPKAKKVQHEEIEPEEMSGADIAEFLLGTGALAKITGIGSRIAEMYNHACNMSYEDSLAAYCTLGNRAKVKIQKALGAAFDMRKMRHVTKAFEDGRIIVCGNFKFLKYNNELMAYQYSGIDMQIEVPAYVGNLPVRYMHQNFLYGSFVNNYKIRGRKAIWSDDNIAYADRGTGRDINKGITEIVLPNTLLAIPGRSFTGCKHLKTLVVPDSVIYVASNAFSGAHISNIYFNGAIPRSFRPSFVPNSNVYVSVSYGEEDVETETEAAEAAEAAETEAGTTRSASSAVPTFRHMSAQA